MGRAALAAIRRAEIVDGAIRVIARAGYEATTMRGLAAELEVSTGTITHWFATKDHVLAATLEELADRFAARMAAELEGAEGARAQLVAIGDASVPDTPERADEQRVWSELAARAARTPALAVLHERLYAGWRRQIERAVRAGADAGELRVADAAEWARTYAALLDGLGSHALLHPDSVTPARMRAAIRTHVDATLG